MNVYDLVWQHEGFRSRPYIDPLRRKSVAAAYDLLPEELDKLIEQCVLTIGAGRNLQAKGINEAEARLMLTDDIQDAQLWLDKELWYQPLGAARKAALIDMAVNLGEAGLREFHDMIRALMHTDFSLAAWHMMHSKWATEVPKRAHDDATIMERGAFPPFDLL